jgi:hypothetical protein
MIASTQVEGWAERFLRRSIGFPPPRLGVISPPVLSIADDGTLRVPAGEELIIAVVAAPGTPPGGTLGVFSPSGARQSMPLADSGSTLVALGDLPAGRTELFLDNPDAEDLLIEPIERPLRRAPAAEFVVRSTGADTTENAVPFFSVAAKSHLERVRDGDLVLTRVVSPPGVRCGVRTRPKLAAEGQERRFVTARGTRVESRVQSAEPMESLAPYLLTVLACAEVEIDFGNFGSVSIRKAGRTTPPMRLPPRVRERIRWLLSNPGADSPAFMFLSAARTRWGLAEIDPRDRDLLTKFFGRDAWPAAVLPHLTVAGNELVRILGRET